MKLSELFRPVEVAPHRLRMEIFALGDRHQGDALAGARQELGGRRLTTERRDLLRAVVAHLSVSDAAGEDDKAAGRRIRLAAAAYVGIFAAAAAWTAMVVRSLMR